MLPSWFPFDALLSTIATLRKTTCREKNILQSWRADFTDNMARWWAFPLNRPPKERIKKHVQNGRRACDCASDTLLRPLESQPLFLSEGLSFLRKQPSVGGGGGGGGAALCSTNLKVLKPHQVHTHTQERSWKNSLATSHGMQPCDNKHSHRRSFTFLFKLHKKIKQIFMVTSMIHPQTFPFSFSLSSSNFHACYIFCGCL